MRKPFQEGRVFFAGVVFFILVKAIWVLGPISIMGLPRTGDDALAYLWSGANSAYAGRASSPALVDIEALYKVAPADADNAFMRDRIVMRTTGSTPSPLYGLIGVAAGAGIDPKLIFAAVELLTATVIALGAGLLLRALFGGAAAALALVVLAISFLPVQGLHFLVPGVLALGLGLLLFRLALQDPPRLLPVGLAAFAAMSVHQIGLVYVAIALAARLSLTVVGKTKEWLRFSAATVAGLGAALALNLSPGARPEVAAGVGGLDFAAIGVNVAGYLRMLWQSALAAAWSEKIVWSALLTGAAAFVIGSGRARRAETLALLGWTSSAAAAAMVFNIPGYPGDLAVRLTVCLLIILAGAGAAEILRALGRLGRGARWTVAAAFVALVAGAAPRAYGLFVDNINSRYPIVEMEELRAQLNELPRAARLLYSETDYALMVALLAGADRLGAVPYPMLDGLDAAQRHEVVRDATHLVALPPLALSGLARMNARTLETRRYGFDFRIFSEITLPMAAAEDTRLFVRATGTDSIQLTAVLSDGHSCPTRLVGVGGDWYETDFRRCAQRPASVKLQSDSGGARLSGFAFAPPASLDWPWGSETARVEALIRGTDNVLVVEFDWSAVFEANGVPGLLPDLARAPVALSDAGGLIIARL